MYHRFDSLQHGYRVSLDLSMSLAKLCEHLARLRLRLSNTDAREHVAERCKECGILESVKKQAWKMNQIIHTF